MTFDPTSARPLEDQPEPAQRFNPAEAQPAGDALLRAQIRRAMGTDPLKASQAEAIARARNLDPEFVLRNYDQVLRETGVEDMARALEVDPMVGDYFRYSPLFAAKAQKDAGALIDVHGTIREFKGPEPTFENIARGLAASLPQGLDIVRTGLQGQIRDFLQWAGMVQPDPVADADFERKLAQAQGAADFTRPEIQSRTGRAIYGGLESTLRTLPGVAASVVTRNPTPALATMGLQTQADAYGKYRTRGGAPLESFLGATGEGAVEVATELLPTKFLTEALGKRGVGEFLTGLIAREAPTEQVATFFQDAIDTAVANPNKTWEEYLAERPGAAYDTLVSTLTQTLVTGGAAKVLSSIAGTADEMGKAEVSARQLQAAFAAAAMVEMRQHAPQDFAQAIQSIAEQEGANDAIYMDAEVLAQSGIDIAQALPSAVDQMADALELNATVRLPIGEVLAAVAGTPQEQLFLQNARASETAWSLAEAEQIAETSKEFLANEQERVLQQAQDQSAWQSEVDTVQQTIKDQLDQAGRFTSDVNEGYARLQSQFFSVMASRFGITPSEMYQRFSVKVAGQMGQGEVLNAGADQIQTPEFKNWFGDSKIVDNSGAPLVVYHGTDETFDVFDRKKQREGKWGKGFYFTTSEAEARNYGKNVIAVYLKADRLTDTRAGGPGGTTTGEGKTWAMKGKMLANGGDVYLVTSPTQIKSATGNQGTFDPNDPNILRQSAFHGTPRRGITQFSTDFIGTGEGAQAYGWGLYFASKREIAEYYRESLGAGAFEYDGKPVSGESPLRVAVELLWSWQGDKAGAIDDAAGYYNASAIKRELNRLDYSKIKRGGQLYEVDIPEDSEMLDWDKKLADQPDAVKKALKESGIWKELKGNLSDYSSPMDTRGKLRGQNIYAYLAWKLGSEKAASDRLRELGILGMRYPAGQIANVKDGSYNYVVFSGDDVAIKNQFYQGQQQQTRGTFNPQTLLISLGPQSDLSTFLHESGHFFLEVMADLAAQPDAPAQVREDMDKVLGWFGVPDIATWQGYTLDQKRPHHERWAESFEQYLLEGKAPSAELQPLFRRFRAWLVNVYKSLTDFMRGRNLELNDEIRQVFDRLLATDDQIAQAEEQAGLLPDFDATNAAIERLQERSLRNLKWTLNARSKFLKQFTKEAKDLRKGILTEVLAEFEQRPDAMASRAIRKVRNKDGAERDAKIAAIADATGYATVEEMTAAVTALGPVNDAVEAEVDRRMLERHGDMATQEALEAAANEAVHNEARARALAAELKSQDEAMNPRETTGRTDARGRPITVNALVEAARAFGADLAARRQVGKLKNAIYLHRAAEARAGKAWQTATKKGDSKAAVQAKKDQLLNNQAVRALLDAQAEVRSAIEFFRKVTKGNNEKLVKGGRDPDVVNAMRAILGAYGIAPRTGKTALEYMELVQKNDPAMYGVIAPSVNTALANAKPFNTLTVEEVRGLTDELKSLWHLAKRSRQMEIDGDLLDLEDLADQLYARMEDIGIPDVLPGETGALTDAELRKRNWLQQAPAILRRVEQWAEAKDGAFGGPFLRFIFQPVKIAADRYRADRLVYRQKFQALVDAIAPTMAKTIIAAPELNYTFGRGHNGIGMAEVLHAILHTGNDSNKRKLLLGRNWATENPDGTLDTSRWDAFIARLITEGTLTKAHYDFAQGVWDLMEETKPLAQKTHRDVFGRYFAEVTANPVTTPFGTYRGGYVPAQADPLLVQEADQRELLETENAGMSYAFPATNRGFTKGRVEYNRPLKLDLRTLPQHIDKVLLFSHMEPAVRSVDRLLRRKKIAQALNKIDPAAINGMLKPWLNRSARQTVETPVSADAGLNRLLSQARARTGMALMMGNISNTLQQITGFSTALLKVKGSHMRRAVAQYIADPKQLKNTVWSLSPYMADRASNEVAVLSDTLEAILLNPSVYQSAERFTRRHAYFLQTAMDNQMSPIIWTAAYNQALAEGMEDRMARRFADGVIRQTQGSTLPEDVSRIETGTAFARAFTQFVGYFNMLANTNATALQQIAREQGLRKGAGKAFGVLMLGMMVPIWVSEIIAQAFRGGPPDDEDDGYLDDWLAAVFGFGTIRGILSGVPVIAQMGQSMVNRFNDNPADDKFSLSPTVSVLESAVAAPHSVYKAIFDEGSAQKAVRDMSALITLRTGLPAMTLARPLGYAAGVAQGKIQPTGPVDAARGVITGTASPESKTP